MFRQAYPSRIARRTTGILLSRAINSAISGGLANRAHAKRRRFNRKRRALGYKMVRAPRSTGPPQFITKRLRTTAYSLNRGGLNYQEYSLKMNSCVDPLGDVGGGKPKWFTQYANIYQQYRVVYCMVKIRVINASNNVGCMIALVPKGQVDTAFTSIDQATECKIAKSTYLPPSGQAYENSRIISLGVPCYKACEVSKAQYNSDRGYQGQSTASDPAHLAHMKFCVEPINTGETTDIDLYIEVIQTVRLFDLTTPSND